MASTKNAVSSNYNTRRKSLSLPSLGIALPVSHASRAARSPQTTSPNTEQPPSKKLKRSHDDDSRAAAPMSPPPKRQSISQTYEHTPPPSPGAQTLDSESFKGEPIDLQGINDEIVEGVIVHLQKTGNKPHLVKQLAELLHKSVRIVEQSANPSAIISSRLSTYLKRACWTASNPCPLAKELETVHPRRTYFYLTTCPHQAIPDPSTTSTSFSSRSLTSPPLSSTHSRSDETESDDARRRELSPSPEVDLSVHELEGDLDIDDETLVAPPTPTGSFSGRLTAQSNKNLNSATRNNRATSPPLDRCEREFVELNEVSKRKFALSKEKSRIHPSIEVSAPSSAVPGMDSGKSDEHLFGLGTPAAIKTSNSLNTGAGVGSGMASSPALRPSRSFENRRVEGGFELSWHNDMCEEQGGDVWDTRSPELVDLDELDGMFEDF